MRQRFCVFWLFLLCLSPIWGQAEPPSWSEFFQLAQQNSLANDPVWRHLLHDQAWEGADYQSEIEDPAFFLSPKGAIDPEAELLADLVGFFAPPLKDQNEHAQCRFIARFEWLNQKLNLQVASSLPKVRCEKFILWAKPSETKSVSLVLVNGFLENPASFFGHILLRLNQSSNDQTVGLLDHSANYGAVVPRGTNGFEYIYKGLTGLYEARYSESIFYKQQHVYGDNELRDLWEYELNLTDKQRRFLLTYLWELFPIKFSYDFFAKNCAYRMANLVEVAIGERLTSQSLPWQLPIDVFHRLVLQQNNGQPLVRKIRFYPSRQQKLRSSFIHLPVRSKEIVRRYAITLEHLDLTAIDPEQQAQILQVLLEYIQFLKISSKNPKTWAELDQKRRVLLQKRLFLPPAADSFLTEEPQIAPSKGSQPTRVSVGAVSSSQFGLLGQWGFRASYHDLISREAGHLENSTLETLNLILLQYKGQPYLDSLTLFKVENFNLASTGLPEDGALAWRFRIGAWREDNDCLDCAQAQVQAAVGEAVNLSSGLFIYGFLESFVFLGSPSHSGLAPALGLAAKPGKRWAFRFEYGLRQSFQGQTQPAFYLENRFGDSPNWDVRLNFRQQKQTEISLLWMRYW